MRKFTHKIRKIAKNSAIILSSTALANMAVITPVQANVGSELNTFFNDMGAAGNVSGPTAFSGQAAGYYTGGSLWTRFPQKNINPVNLQLPSVSAGCGGIDIFGGSFSFINTDEIVATLKSVASNSLGFAFQLAIKSISPQISQTIEEFAQKVQQMNQFNMNSCEMAQGLVGGLWGKNQGRESEVCKAIANSQGWATDWAKSRQNCNAGGERDSIMGKNTDDNMPADSYNYTWHMLNESYPGFSRELKEYLMTLVGTIIYLRAPDAGGTPTYKYIGIGDTSVLTVLLDGSTLSPASRLKCDTLDKCLNPTTRGISVNGNQALIPRITKLIRSMNDKVKTNGRLSNEEIGLLGGTSIPLYKIITVNAASQFGQMNTAEIDSLAEIVASDLLESFIQHYYSYVSKSQASFQNADEETLDQWRKQVQSVRQILTQQSEKMGARLERTQYHIERSLYLESTMRNSLSPQMSAAVSFNKSQSAQAVQ